MICPIFTRTSPVWIRRINKENPQERAHLERFLGPLEHRLASQNYLVGDSFTAADIVCAYDLGILFGV